jgi:alpha-L-fucosidase
MIGLDNTWDYPATSEKKPGIYYENKSIPQIKELVANYAPDVMWFDVPTDISKQRSFEILKIIRQKKPDCIINDRISNEHQQKKLVMGDFYTPEQYLPENLNMDFETCMTLNDTWGYKYYDNNWKDVETIVENLVINASMGGNYLLNVGPGHLGRIPPQSVQLLKAAGHWLGKNGESIYGTVKSPLKHVFYDNGACTFRPGKLYIHLFEWPQSNEFVLPEVQADVERIYFLANNNEKNSITQLPIKKI